MLSPFLLIFWEIVVFVNKDYCIQVIKNMVLQIQPILKRVSKKEVSIIKGYVEPPDKYDATA